MLMSPLKISLFVYFLLKFHRWRNAMFKPCVIHKVRLILSDKFSQTTQRRRDIFETIYLTFDTKIRWKHFKLDINMLK